MRIKLDYGKTGMEVEVPDRNLVGPLGLRPVEPLADPAGKLAEALAHPIGSAPLVELARAEGAHHSNAEREQHLEENVAERSILASHPHCRGWVIVYPRDTASRRPRQIGRNCCTG